MSLFCSVYGRLLASSGRNFRGILHIQIKNVISGKNTLKSGRSSGRNSYGFWQKYVKVVCDSLPLGMLFAAAPVYNDIIASQSSTLSSDSNSVSSKAVNVPDPSTLTNSYLMQQASVAAVDAATRVLTQTVVACLQAEDEYQKAVRELIHITEYSLTVLGNEYEEEKVWQRIIEARNETDDKKKVVNDLELIMTSASTLIDKVAETAFLVGADYAGTAATERLYSAEQYLKRVKDISRELENSYLVLSEKSIRVTTEFNEKRVKAKEK